MTGFVTAALPIGQSLGRAGFSKQFFHSPAFGTTQDQTAAPEMKVLIDCHHFFYHQCLSKLTEMSLAIYIYIFVSKNLAMYM